MRLTNRGARCDSPVPHWIGELTGDVLDCMRKRPVDHREFERRRDGDVVAAYLLAGPMV